MRLGGGQPLAREHHRHRGVIGDVARQPVHASRRRHQSDPRLGQSERGVLGRHDDVAGEHQLESAPEREAVDRRDDRLEAVHATGQPAEAARQPAPQLAHVFGAVLGLELQVVARAERLLPRPGQYRHPLVRVVLERVEHLFHLPDRVGMQGIHHLRAIDPHGRDVIGRRYLDEFVAHGIPLSVRQHPRLTGRMPAVLRAVRPHAGVDRCVSTRTSATRGSPAPASCSGCPAPICKACADAVRPRCEILPVGTSPQTLAVRQSSVSLHETWPAFSSMVSMVHLRRLDSSVRPCRSRSPSGATPGRMSTRPCLVRDSE